MVAGFLPIAGRATRLFHTPKFLQITPQGTLLDRHLAMMKEAGAWSHLDVRASHYRMLDERYGRDLTLHRFEQMSVVASALRLKAHVGEHDVLFGMADTYFDDAQCYVKLARALKSCDVAVGVWEIQPEQRGKLGQVMIDQDCMIQHVIDKDANCSLPYVWGALAWRSTFWGSMSPHMSHFGMAIEQGLRDGLQIKAVFMRGKYWDCGTPDEYFRLCSSFVGV